jgi:hypothetical protein
MNETRDRLDRLIRRVRALRADADRLRPYALDVASKAAEVCVQSYHLRNEARTLVSQMVSHKFTLACSLRWTPETGQVAKRESSLGTAGRPRVRHGQYSEETQR